MANFSLPETLDLACQATGLEFDSGLVAQLDQEARRMYPGPLAETWSERLAWIAKGLGMRTTPARVPLDEVARLVEPDHPIFVPARGTGSETVDDQLDGALVVGSHGRRLLVTSALGYQEPITPGQLARQLGIRSVKEPIDVVILAAIAPCEGLHRDQHLDQLPSHDIPTHAHEPGHAEPAVPPFERLLGLMKPEWRDIRVVLGYAVAVGILSLAAPLAIEVLVSTVALNQLAQQLLVISLVLFACLAVAAILQALQTYVVELIQRRLFVRVAADLAYRLPKVRVEAWDRHDGPELVNRFFDILTVQKVGALLLLDGIAIVLGAGFGLIVLASYSPYLLGFDLIILAALTFTVFLLGRGAVRTSIQESRAKYAVAGCLEEMARAPVAYKMGQGPEYAIDRADRLSRFYLDARRRHFRILMRQIVFALGFQAVATAGMLGLGGWLVINYQLTLGQLVAAELIVATVIGSFAKLGKHLEGWYDLMAAVEKLGHLIDLPLERRNGEDPSFEPVGTTVEAHHVSYSYGHTEVLRGLDLEIRSGERIALVGPSGSGKSTLADILYGLREPTHGYVTYDGINLRDLSLVAVREEVALVKGLDVVDDTILENVRMGRHHLGLKEVYDALTAVQLADEVAALPDGLHTRLFPTGAPLSLGQARRLMLARAIAGRPNLLVLDEALDGLDLDSREAVFDAVLGPGRNWTVIVVTHSQEVASRCDRAVAIVDGKADHDLSMQNGHKKHLTDWLKEVGQ
ncbi:MAG: hypothetical protein KatS3mg108_2903 [Isosphaeraceae bacterium]|jgi:ABC-type bacteriocin/lantibiotic exporter with double-glycine peptidase domain|nr:MAG: hypothetical protein KatS3mg108_2903 [Isosphaeraceae bacterium]